MNRISADWNVPAKVVAFSTTRIGGVSESNFASLNLAAHVGDDPRHVEENRALLEASLPQGIKLQWLNQIHSTDVVAIDHAGQEITADAVITRQENLVCAVQTADCLPLFVSSLAGDEVAMIHAGWKGLAAGIIENTIQTMSSEPKDLAVWLGPAIGPCHFEVGSEVRELFLSASTSNNNHNNALKDCFAPTQQADKYMADLYALAKIKLAWLGVESVSGGSHCTHCDADQFFSYRRDGVTGRMLNLIYIEA